MNVLLLYSRGVLPNDGGIATISKELVRSMRSDGHNVILLGYKDLKKSGYDEHQLFLPNGGENVDENVLYVEGLCRRECIDLIVNQVPLDPPYMNLIPRIKGRVRAKIISCLHNPVMSQVTNLTYRKEYELRKRGLGFVLPLMKTPLIKGLLSMLYKCKYRRTYRKILSFSDKVVVLCDGMKAELLDMVGSKGDSKIEIIPNFIQSVPVIDFSKKERIIVWCGTVDFDVKRVDVVLSLWGKLQGLMPDWELKILGSGSKMEEAKRIAEGLQLERFSFEGRVDPCDYYKRAKFLFVTSSFESFSLVTAEAMSFGVVPVVFDTFPMASLLVDNGQNGFLVAPYDKDAFVQKVLEIAYEEGKWKAMGGAAVQKSSSYISSSVFDSWRKLFCSVVE